jgi:uncharacterized membrane protein
MNSLVTTNPVNDDAGMTLGIVLILIWLCCYLIPTFVAMARSHRNTAPIAVLNVFLGWTVVGWVVALCWAVAYQAQAASRADQA